MMHFSHLKPSVHSTSSNLAPSCSHVLDFAQLQPSSARLNCRIPLVKNLPTLKPVSSKGPQTCKELNFSINLEDASHVCQEQGQYVKQSELESVIEDTTVLDSWSNSKEIVGVVDRLDDQRRNIELAKKRKVPWNKGVKHSAETRERISFKTKEALRDPKVRMKMSEHPRRPLSKRIKAKIGASQARLWDERLKWKRSREKFLKLWYDSIAKAAKRGGRDQDKLDWDSYEKLDREIALEQLQLAADKEEAKLMKRMLAKEKAEEKARLKAEKMEKWAQRRKDDEERMKLSGKSMRKQRSKEEIEELAVARGLKLKERLTKIHKKKTRDGLVTGQDQRAWDSLDLESLDKENGTSLADQIQAIRSKRAENLSRDEIQMTSHSLPRSELAQVLLAEKEMK